MKMKRTAFLYVLMFLIVAPLFGQTSAITGYCVLGAKQAITSGLNSTNYLQGVIPQCTVTVYLTGTTTLATIYADSSSTPLTNPFTANTDGSWLFYPATSQGYDVALSGGVSPNTYPSPVTLTDLFPGGGSGGTTVNVNGSSVSNPNFNGTTPTAGSGYVNGVFQVSGSSVSVEVPTSSAGGVTQIVPGANVSVSPSGGVGTVTLSVTGGTFTSPTTVSNTFAAKNLTSIGPRYDVTQYGATGNGSTDDTSAIQAAYTACYNNGVAPRGGIVEFPGAKTYVISSTINVYDGCATEGIMETYTGGQAPPEIKWNGAAAGATSATTGFVVSSNSAYITTPSSPIAGVAPSHLATFTGTNSFSAHNWVIVTGCTSTSSLSMNYAVGEVTSASSSQFTIATSEPLPSNGTYTDTCTATTINVAIATDTGARYQESFTNILIQGPTVTSASALGINIYYGSRVDTGTRLYNTWMQDAQYFGYYFSGGGINTNMGGGWRCDSVETSCVYWRLNAFDDFEMGVGTVDNSCTTCTSGSGGVIMVDATGRTGDMYLDMHDIKFESNTNLQSGIGMVTLLDNPNNTSTSQAFFNFNTVWNQHGGTVTTYPSIVVSPANDAALEITVLNSLMGSSAPFVGIPALSRINTTGSAGSLPFLSYSPSWSMGIRAGSSKAVLSLLGDVNIGQFYQNTVQASAFLYSDTAFGALPNGTTLLPGQIIAPPTYWKGVNGNRYAIDVVYQSGTTGTPNSGNTTCTGTSGTYVLTCSSATDLSAGQRISIGTDTNKSISYIDATNSSAVVVNLQSTLSATYSTATALTFFTPTFGPEIQFPTKSSAAPTTLTWSQGDMEQNSGATANGIAAWVNVVAGTAGTWAAIPLGNSSGQINTSQISNTTGSGAAVLATSPTISNPVITGAPTYSATSAYEQDFLVHYSLAISSGANSQVITVTAPTTGDPAQAISAIAILTSSDAVRTENIYTITGYSTDGINVQQIASNNGSSSTQTLYLTQATSGSGTTWTFSIVNMSASSVESGVLKLIFLNSGGAYVSTVTAGTAVNSSAAAAPWEYAPSFQGSFSTSLVPFQSLTTTGSGAASLSGGVLNVPSTIPTANVAAGTLASGMAATTQAVGNNGTSLSTTGFVAQIQGRVIGTAISSATTIAPVSPIVHVTGAAAIATITAPTGCTTAGIGCQVILIPDGLWTTTTGGNIAIVSSAVVSKAETMTYDPATSVWYPSY
jgi:hypothetical protein